jgi:hypothetical protein
MLTPPSRPTNEVELCAAVATISAMRLMAGFASHTAYLCGGRSVQTFEGASSCQGRREGPESNADLVHAAERREEGLMDDLRKRPQ